MVIFWPKVVAILKFMINSVTNHKSMATNYFVLSSVRIFVCQFVRMYVSILTVKAELILLLKALVHYQVGSYHLNVSFLILMENL